MLPWGLLVIYSSAAQHRTHEKRRGLRLWCKCCRWCCQRTLRFGFKTKSAANKAGSRPGVGYLCPDGAFRTLLPPRPVASKPPDP